MSGRRWAVVAVLLCPGAVLAAGPYMIQPIALDGQPTPAGGTYRSIGSGVDINDAGQVAFSAHIDGGTAGMGLFLYDGGTVANRSLNDTSEYYGIALNSSVAASVLMPTLCLFVSGESRLRTAPG